LGGIEPTLKWTDPQRRLCWGRLAQISMEECADIWDINKKVKTMTGKLMKEEGWILILDGGGEYDDLDKYLKYSIYCAAMPPFVPMAHPLIHSISILLMCLEMDTPVVVSVAQQ
jgi:hypothetical protein